uniref:Uncharacterized protein n=1 Tax=Phakopsora pachyrhizi TaxID=170000 RepID=A0A0S1MJA3_PHAPC
MRFFPLLIPLFFQFISWILTGSIPVAKNLNSALSTNRGHFGVWDSFDSCSIKHKSESAKNYGLENKALHLYNSEIGLNNIRITGQDLEFFQWNRIPKAIDDRMEAIYYFGDLLKSYPGVPSLITKVLSHVGPKG